MFVASSFAPPSVRSSSSEASSSRRQRFGADYLVPMAVALGITRELGPLMTAIVVAGRSGSAFAAEIGTMKVNEEVAALDAMGLDRTRFLVLPKLIAMFAMMPFLVEKTPEDDV